MAERSVTDVVRDTIVHERTAMLVHRRSHARGIDEAVRLGRMSVEEGALCKRWVAAFADDCAIGLHVEHDPDGVREAMRSAIKQQIDQMAKEAS